MSDDQDEDVDTAERDEIAELLKDPQVREFIELYLRISQADARAHLRRVAAAMARPSGTPDLERQRRLGLSPRSTRRSARPRPA